MRAVEAQGRGFAHGHEKLYSELNTKAIDIIQLFLGCRSISATEHEGEFGSEDHVRGVGSAEQLI